MKLKKELKDFRLLKKFFAKEELASIIEQSRKT